jgi:hypothetical protein
MMTKLPELYFSLFPLVTYKLMKTKSNLLILLRIVSSGLLRRLALVRTDVSEEPGTSFIRVTKIGELATTQAATSNRTVGSYNSHTA